MNDKFTLFEFQEIAANRLREAALGWVNEAALTQAPQYGTNVIPFVGQLKAVTGSGKTPILADVVAGIGDAVILWTSKSSAVVEQTYQNLRGKYASLLPGGVRVLRNIPSQKDWLELISEPTGLTVWVVTTGSWNEIESAKKGGAGDARLNLHRPQPDWAGGDRSPWEQLATDLIRPLWVVSDESHNQTDVQLDQLAGLNPVGFFMASATPVTTGLFEEWRKALNTNPDWAKRSEDAVVAVRTRDVVLEELLKTTLELLDFQSGTEESLDGALDALAKLDEAVEKESALVTPRAIYVVEQSNPRRGSTEDARPVVIWNYLRSKGVEADEIAVYTDTKLLPPDAEQISSLSRLQRRHRHIIFNQSLQEGWDDPEAYVCYFDGTTKSFTRIRQIVGRVLRQPGAKRYSEDVLNTATLILNTPSETFETVLDDLQMELRLYAPEDEPTRSPIKVKTKKDPLPEVPMRSGDNVSRILTRYSLSAPDMSKMAEKIVSQSQRPWPAKDLLAPGLGKISTVHLEEESKDVAKTDLIKVLRSARSQNSLYLRRRLGSRNRDALISLHPDLLSQGPSFEQWSCQGSQAQADLTQLTDEVADYYEERVGFEQDADPEASTWAPFPHRPRSARMVSFKNSLHAEYSRDDFNNDEFAFAQALDAADLGPWMRNPSTTDIGYYLPLPARAGDSSRFFPDFLLWVGDVCWAIDTTGRHLLTEKIRGKLVQLDEPQLALVVRGEVDIEKESARPGDGWTAVIARKSLKPITEHSDDLRSLLEVFRTPPT